MWKILAVAYSVSAFIDIVATQHIVGGLGGQEIWPPMVELMGQIGFDGMLIAKTFVIGYVVIVFALAKPILTWVNEPFVKKFALVSSSVMVFFQVLVAAWGMFQIAVYYS